MKINDENYKNAFNFYLLATKLKNKIRSGWDEKHWNVKKDRIESVAEHVYGTCILAIAMESEFSFDIDLNRVIKMLVIHEIGEVMIGDITPFDKVTPEEKNRIELQAVYNVLGDLSKKEELASLFIEFDAQETKDARFAFLCDKLEADFQSKVYQDLDCHHSLNDQENNVVFKSDKIRQFINNGATTAFDVWYEWDKHIFDNNKEFSKMLNYIKDNDTKINNNL